MKKERNALSAGLFIIVAVALIIAVVLGIKGGARFTEGRVTRVVSFRLSDDIGGLRVGDDVRVGGWKVGTIQNIEASDLDSANPRLLVSFSLPGRFKLKQHAKVGVQQTLTGSASLNIDDLGRGAEYAEADVIAGRPDPKSTLLASLSDAGSDIAAITKDVRGTTVPKLNTTLDSFKATGDSATALVGDVKQQIPPIVQRYNGVADKTSAMMQSITDMVGPSTEDWKGLLKNLNQSSASLNAKIPAMLEKLDKTLEEAKAAMEDVKTASSNIKEVTAAAKQVIGGNEGKLESMISSLKATGDNLKQASIEIRRSPWRLLYKPAPNEMANLNIFDSAREFAEGANDLNDAATSLRDALKTGGANEKQIHEMMDRLEKSFQKFHSVEGKLWSEVKQ